MATTLRLETAKHCEKEEKRKKSTVEAARHQVSTGHLQVSVLTARGQILGLLSGHGQEQPLPAGPQQRSVFLPRCPGPTPGQNGKYHQFKSKHL